MRERVSTVRAQKLYCWWTQVANTYALAMYAIATIPFINHLGNVEDLKQVWYADDASAVGSLHST